MKCTFCGIDYDSHPCSAEFERFSLTLNVKVCPPCYKSVNDQIQKGVEEANKVLAITHKGNFAI